MSQNTSSAVMSQRKEPPDSLDFFPTPGWAARALVEHVLIGGGWHREQLAQQVCWEPACGEGHMADALEGYFYALWASDVHDYGFGGAFIHDFLFPVLPRSFRRTVDRPDWIITNPPFRLGAEFVLRALDIATVGVAMLVRTAFIEGVGRHEALFSKRRPAILAPFVERVPMFKGRVDPRGSTATSYCWLVWSKLPHHVGQTTVRWIPPCRKALERDGDYGESR